MEGKGRSIARLLGRAVLALTIITGLAAAAMAAVTTGLMLSPALRERLAAEAAAHGSVTGIIGRAPGLLLVVVLILVLALVLLLRLRAVLRTVERGEPFHPSNPGNLRQIVTEPGPVRPLAHVAAAVALSVGAIVCASIA